MWRIADGEHGGDQAWIGGDWRVARRVYAQRGQCLGIAIGDEHVGARQQRLHQRPGFGGTRSQFDGALAAIESEEGGADIRALLRRRGVAQPVAARGFEFDDFGAELSQMQSRGGAGNAFGEFNDTDTFQHSCIP